MDIGQLNALFAATVTVNGLPAARTIVVIEQDSTGSFRVSGSGNSDEFGNAELTVSGNPESLYYAVATDSWGDEWAPSMEVTAGDVIRPTAFAGFVFRVISSGTLPSTEPEWWTTAVTSGVAVGSAVLEAVRYFQPVAHGPLSLAFENKDPYWEYVFSLLHFDAISPIVDETGRSWEVFGNIELDSNVSKFGGASLKVVSEGVDYIRIPADGGMNFGVGDFTVELFHRRSNSATGATLMGSGQNTYEAGNSWTLFFAGTEYGNPSGTLTLVGPVGGVSNKVLHSGQAFPVGEFKHIAITRSAGVMRMFIDGEMTSSLANSGSVDFSGGGTYIGASGWTKTMPTLPGAKGHYEEFRVTKGMARYVENFTPPAAPFLYV